MSDAPQTPDTSQLSNRDILLELRADVKAAMLHNAVMGERVDNIIKTQAEVKLALTTKDETLDGRMKSIEDWRTRIMGMLVVIGAAVSFAASLAKDAVASAFHWGH